MSGSRRGVVVSREYVPVPEDCARALALLLKKSASREGGPETAPDNGTKSKEDFADAVRR
jgi:hypothetical protein